MSIDDLLEAKYALKASRDQHLESLAGSFSGMRLVENPMLNRNEVAIMCGTEVYKELQKRIKDS